MSKMIDAAATGKHHVKWSHVLHYLKAQCIVKEDDDDENDDDEHDDRNSSHQHEHQHRQYPFDIPFQRYYTASNELLQELAPNPTTGQSILRTTISYGPVVPLAILQALCYLGPLAVTQSDTTTKCLLLHHVCRFPPLPPSSSSSSSLHAVFDLLIKAHPPALLHRDHEGCTPLHYLFRYHAESRTAATTQLFLYPFVQNKHLFFTLRQPISTTTNTTATSPSSTTAPPIPPLPDIPRPTTHNQLPCHAAIVPDAIHGCLPLHYAIVHGAPYETLQTLLTAYPASKHVVDRYHRTPLHYLLGASVLWVEGPTGNSSSSSTTTTTSADTLTTISGEPLPPWHYDDDSTNNNNNNDDNSPPKKLTLRQQQNLVSQHYYYYHNPIDVRILQLLLTSRVARTVDAIHQRCPLHALALYLAHQTFQDDPTTEQELVRLVQIVIDSYAKQCVGRDRYGRTPILLLLDTVQKLQYRIYMEQCHNSGRQLSHGYSPALPLIQLLIQAPLTRIESSSRDDNNNDDSPVLAHHWDDAGRIVALEDHEGRLPLHVALQVVTPPAMVQLLVVAYPASLVHTTTHDMWCPLHTALCCHYTAHLQPIETIRRLLFQSYKTGPYGTTVDGRLAMKMEDARGYFPIHYACQNQVAASIITLLVERYPNCARQVTGQDDDLPIHCLVQHLPPVLAQQIRADLTPEQHHTQSDDDDENVEFLQEQIMDLRVKLNVLLRPLVLSHDVKLKLVLADSKAGMLPLHIAILFQAVDYPMLLKMLQLYPYAAMQYTNNLQCLLLHHLAADANAANVHSYSALDLHDMCQGRRHRTVMNVYNDVEWYRIRELLFSFGPTLESHRHRQDLLDHGVQIVIDELRCHEQEQEPELDRKDEHVQVVEENAKNEDGDTTTKTHIIRPGYHFIASNTEQSLLPDLEITHSVSAMEAEIGLRPRARRRRRRKVSKRLPSNQSRHHPSASNVSSGSHLHRTHTLPNGPTSGSDTLTTVDNNTNNRMVQLDMLQLKNNSSIYDDDDVRFTYDDDDDDGDDGSYISGEDGSSGNDDSYISEEDDDDLGTDECDTQDDSATRGSLSQGTTSRSQLRTTFEEDEEEDGTVNGSEADTGSDDLTSRRGTTFDDGETGTTRSYDDESVSTARSHSQRAGHSTVTRSFSRFPGPTTTNTATIGSDSRRVTFDDESTGLSNGNKSFDMNHAASSFFDLPRENPVSMEEKKDEGNDQTPEPPSTPRTANRNKKTLPYQRPPYMSEVGMRIWTFFVMYCDVNNPKDNYADKLAAIAAAIKFSTWEELVSCPLPPYAKNYIKNSNLDIEGLSFRDVASPKCRALIHKTSHFLGKYDFRSDRDILVYRTTQDDSIIVEASEWLYTTEAVTNVKNSGVTEEKIWSTGEVPAEIGVTFETHQRPVWIKFTKNASEYDNEIDCRVRLGVSVDDESVIGTGNDVIPILQHFNAISTERKHDQDYSLQRTDKRFQSLNLINGSTQERKVQILLHEYPFVIVYPAPLRGTLYDYFLKHGISQTSECRQILTQIVHALGFLHNNGICHGNVCMRNIVSLDSNARDGLYWGFLNFSCATFMHKSSNQFLGGIDKYGCALFETETLPPEMFMRVTANELKQYLAYWAVVERRFNVTIDKRILNSYFDSSSGSTYVIKCHFVPLTLGDNDVPLPYKLVPSNTSSDFWALGQLLFVLHTGRNLFHVSARDGRLYDYAGVCNWDGRSLIYEHVDDELLQDVLLLCLSLNESRKRLTVTDLLHHPFFTGDCLSKKVLEARQVESTAHKLNSMKKLYEASENKWLIDHSTTIYCWNFDILERFNYSPTETVRKLMCKKAEIRSPCSAVLLPYDPYDISGGNYGHVAERLGIELLELGKVCRFCVAMKHVVDLARCENRNVWSFIELEKILGTMPSSFSKIKAGMNDLASRHVEEFRRNPIAVAMKLITQQIENVYMCFEDRNMYLYLVDEYSLFPIPITDSRIPVAANHRIELFTKVLPLTHLCLLYARVVKNGLPGLATILLPNSKCEVPSSWSSMEADQNNLSFGDSLAEEVAILLEAQKQSNASQLCISDSVSAIRDYLVEVDPNLGVGGLRRVVVANTCLWTNHDGVSTLEDAARSYTLSDALRNTRFKV